LVVRLLVANRMEPMTNAHGSAFTETEAMAAASRGAP
jgi:hypothetical protein